MFSKTSRLLPVSASVEPQGSNGQISAQDIFSTNNKTKDISLHSCKSYILIQVYNNKKKHKQFF